MSDISFQKSKNGYVAEFDAPGDILMQIQSENGGRLTMYQFIEGMEPAKISTCQFTNEIINLNVPAGLKVRLESDVEVKACKYIQKPSANAGAGGDGEPYVLPQASASALGGVKLGFTQTGKRYPLVLDGSGKAYIEVPWTDENTTYNKASDSALGLVKIGYSQNAKKYAVQLDADGKAYVEVPWTDNNTTYQAANASTLGLVKQAASVTDATGPEDVVAQFNSLKANLVTAGIVADS